jgi:ureidoglycolate lyase
METSVQAPVAAREVTARTLTRETFAPFGDLITPTEDGTAFGTPDAALDLSGGTSRLYILRLPFRGLVSARNVSSCPA